MQMFTKNRGVESVLASLQKQQYAEIPCSLSYDDFENAAQCFFEFLPLSREKKDHCYVRPTRGQSEEGYAQKAARENVYTHKHSFHYHPSLEEAYFSRASLQSIPVISRFFHSARKIFDESEILLKMVFGELETTYPDIHSKIFPLRKESGSALRFLKYDSIGRGEVLTRGHYDVSVCTLALAESAPGLRLGKGPETLAPVTRNGKSCFLLTGYTFRSLVGNTSIVPTWHDVVQESSAVPGEIARWSVVFFAGAHDCPLPDYEETKRPLLA